MVNLEEECRKNHYESEGLRQDGKGPTKGVLSSQLPPLWATGAQSHWEFWEML